MCGHLKERESKLSGYLRSVRIGNPGRAFSRPSPCMLSDLAGPSYVRVRIQRGQADSPAQLHREHQVGELGPGVTAREGLPQIHRTNDEIRPPDPSCDAPHKSWLPSGHAAAYAIRDHLAPPACE